MIELKTLKDFICDEYNEISQDDGVKPFEDVIRVKDLKAEAVKWVKYYDKESEDMARLRGHWEIKFIKHFFNLTEEDLK